MKIFGDKTNTLLQVAQAVCESTNVQLGVGPAKQTDDFWPALVLETPSGTLNGGLTICRYLSGLRPDKGLYGHSHYQHSQVDQWLYFATHNLSKFDQKTFAFVDELLAKCTYLVGEGITVADIATAAYLTKIVTPENIKPYVNLTRWLDTIVNQKTVKKALGEVKLHAPAAPATPAPATENDEQQPAKPDRNPLMDLPPSPMNLDAWKRTYSNSKDLYGEVMTYFWTNFDAQGWSLWYMKYDKLEGECTVPYVTSNQLGGFLQRTDPDFRKYAFGNCNVIGEGKNYDITGVWLFRGTEMPFQMKDHPSYEYHTWRKLDHTNEADKKLVADYWCANETVEGVRIEDSKIYK